jgi:hypothetical protein
MLPFEEENAQQLHQHFQRYFEASQAMLVFSQNACEQFTKSVKGTLLDARAASVLSGMLITESRKFRALTLLCERGFVSEAQQLVRSAFEGALAARFVCDEPVSANNLPPGIRPANYPPIPNGALPVNFRAYIFGGHMLMQKSRRALDSSVQAIIPQPVISNVLKMAQDFECDVGSDWSKRIGKRNGYSGLSVKDLAGNYELDSLYDGVYKELSNQVHANNALSVVSYDADGSVALMWCGKGESHIPTTLQLAVACLADTIKTTLLAVNRRDVADQSYFLAAKINRLP